MLFEFDKLLSKPAARAMTAQSLAERQRDVYESHRHRVFSLACHMTGNEIEAESLLRDTFISAFRRNPVPDQPIVDAALIDQLRTRMDVDPVPGAPAPPPSLPIRRNILRPDLEDAIRCLPGNERLVFLLADVEGYPAPRIAALLGMTDSAVLRAAMTARLRLRARLSAARADQEQAA